MEARIRDASFAFRPDGDALVALAPRRGIAARFEADGATLSVGDDAILVHAGLTTIPALGDCVADRVDPSGACVRRLEYVGAGLTEWWEATPEGFEQGWTLYEPIPAIEVGISGAEAVLGDGEVRLHGELGADVLVSGLVAWDADGAPVPVRFEASDGGFRVVVEDTSARYPIEIDPLYTTAAWSVDGEDASYPFGEEVASAGDVDGDGYDDVIVGSSYAYGYESAYVYYGSASGLSAASLTTLTGTIASGYFGASVAGAGDVNNDGYDDVIVGAYGTSALKAYIFHGSAAGLATTPVTTLAGTTSSAFGHAVSGAGDVNGDGYDDVIVGAYTTSSSAGRAYVYHGSASGIATTVRTTLSGGGGDELGAALAPAGDVNRDGYADVIVGGPGYGADKGRAFVYHGSASGLGTTATSTLTGGSTDDSFGRAVASAGDVDGDGYDDVVVGAYGYGAGNGAAYVFSGSASGVSTSPATTITGGGSSYFLGYSVAGVGDVNGDGYDDVVLGALGYSSYRGAAYLHLGSIAGISYAAATTFTGSTSDRLGTAVAGGGDINGDGLADVVVGAPEHLYVGRLLVYNGNAEGLTTVADDTIIGRRHDELGTSVASAGDVNADGYDDVIVGAPGYLYYTGHAYVFHGGASGLATTAATTLTGTSSQSGFGAAVDGAGDVNGDGYSDVIVGAWGTTSRAGTASVYLGSAAGVASTAGSTITSASSDWFGYSVAGLGDVNADGYDDVAIGGYYYSTYTGRVCVHHGSASGISTAASKTLTGGTPYDRLGISVAAAGDVNNDGYDDMIIGASGYSSSAGRAYVYHGSAAGFTSATTTLTGYGASHYFGYDVDGAGDVNGDGYDDVVVGAYGYGTDTGRAYVYHGSSAGISASPTSLVTGASGSYLGASVAGAGDIDGDGYDDVIVGAYGADAAYLYLGSAAGMAMTATSTLTGTTDSDFGAAVASAGDVDGDGLAEVIVGASDDAGHVALYRGYDIDADGDGTSARSDCDDSDASVAALYVGYADTDSDGYGDAGSSTSVCGPAPTGYVTDATDCNDADGAIHPGATEVCDAANVDEDCDGGADDADAGVTGRTPVYADIDDDGFGATAADYCDPPAGWVATSGDCDDASAGVNPGAAEVCDAADTDEDCDGMADDASAAGRTTWYVDGDDDGYGSSVSTLACELPAGHAATATDCDDANAGIHPGATEVCDAATTDEDCDGLADDADTAAGTSTFYRDADSDGHGGATSRAFCVAPAGYVATSTDCDDAATAVHPGAAEVCDAANTDEDCDGRADDATASGESTFYADTDGDGYGAAGSTTSACDAPSGFVTDATDCDDVDAGDHPAAAELVGNGDDEDCDGAETCYTDADADGFRGTTSVASADADCADAGEALATMPSDCDDTDATVSGGAAEIIGDGVDQDCDGAERCYADADGDGYRPDDTLTVASDDLDCADEGETDGVAEGVDCDDDDPAFHPGAEEANCVDPNDYNCDGSSGYGDGDGDGYGACEECDDERTSVHPGAEETCNDRDDDCDGSVDDDAADAETWYADADDDGYTDPSERLIACDPAEGYTEVSPDPDCDDDAPATHPDAVDVPEDGVDQDCDGLDAVGPAGHDTADDTGGGGGKDDEACGCVSGGDAAGASPLVALAGLLIRRRKRS